MHDGTGDDLTERSANADRRADGPEGEIKAARTLREIGNHEDRDNAKYSGPHTIQYLIRVRIVGSAQTETKKKMLRSEMNESYSKFSNTFCLQKFTSSENDYSKSFFHFFKHDLIAFFLLKRYRVLTIVRTVFVDVLIVPD
jgi:hypothetical protein